jgi:AAA15 family ATPase/GTPase
MIDSLEISGFKCFKHIQLKDLSRINFIVGDNGTGKTALLEALFMASGNSASTYLVTRIMRGIMGLGMIQTRESFASVFRSIFHNMDAEAGAVVRFVDSERGERELRIGFEKDSQTEIFIPEKASYESA